MSNIGRKDNKPKILQNSYSQFQQEKLFPDINRKIIMNMNAAYIILLSEYQQAYVVGRDIEGLQKTEILCHDKFFTIVSNSQRLDL